MSMKFIWEMCSLSSIFPIDFPSGWFIHSSEWSFEVTYFMLLSISSFRSVQFSPVTQSCLTPGNPMDGRTPGLPVHHQLPEFTQTHVHWVSGAIQPSHPLSSLSPPGFNLSQHRVFYIFRCAYVGYINIYKCLLMNWPHYHTPTFFTFFYSLW